MTILEKLQGMKTDKDANLLPANIRAGITIFGVTGGLTTVSTVAGKNTTSTQLDDNNSTVVFSNASDNLTDKILLPSTVVNLEISYANLAQAIGLSADKIKQGETILGVTGTYDGTN